MMKLNVNEKNKIIMNDIISFRGEYRWLSNFAPVEIHYNGKKYQSVEAAYQSAKCDDQVWKNFCQRGTPSDIKRQGKLIALRPDWDEVKYNIMKELITQKFVLKPYKQLLVDTGDVQIIERNTWNDTYWGVNSRTGEGLNNLGKLIMNMRETLQVYTPATKEL